MVTTVTKKSAEVAAEQIQNTMSLESTALKELKQELKAIFTNIAEKKEKFDDSRNAEERH